MSSGNQYTCNLTQGLGLIDETLSILELWEPGMGAVKLYEKVLSSGLFSTMTARRVKNIVVDVVRTRYLVDNGKPAMLIKAMAGRFNKRAVSQIMYVYTCQVNRILFDFITDVYWSAFAACRDSVTGDMALQFVRRAVAEGKTTCRWSDSVIRRNAAYLIGACSDFGLLEKSRKTEKKICSLIIDADAALIIAHELHFSGLGDNAIVSNEIWSLFGLDRSDVIDTLKRISVRGALIVQQAGEVLSIGWKYKNMEELVNGIA